MNNWFEKSVTVFFATENSNLACSPFYRVAHLLSEWQRDAISPVLYLYQQHNTPAVSYQWLSVPFNGTIVAKSATTKTS